MPNRYESKMSEFVDKLLSQPALADQPIVQRENQVLNFIKENGAQLRTAFAQDDFFPELPFDQAVRLLVTILTDRVLKAVEAEVSSAMKRLSIKGVGEHFRSSGSIDADALQAYFLEQIRHKATRDQFFYSAQSVTGGFYERYLPVLIGRRKGVYNEVIRRDRLTMEPTLIPGYLGLCAMFRPLFWMKFTGQGGQQICLADQAKNASSFRTGYGALEQELLAKLSSLPQEVYGPGIESCADTDVLPDASGAAKFVTIMVNRAVDYHPNQKVDKGAESPDKSWFHINRRTAKYYGYDPHFLDELYQVAGEEGW